MAKSYRDVMDFAFFAVNFGYSKSDYENLTPTEKAFIMKAWEDKTVADSTVMRDSVLNAITNAFRKKGKKFKTLWKKKQEKADKEVVKNNYKIIMEVEKKEGKDWIDKVFRANGIKRKWGEKSG